MHDNIKQQIRSGGKSRAPVVVENLLFANIGKESGAKCDGYAYCPPTTSRDKIMRAEFCDHGVVTPSFPHYSQVLEGSSGGLKKLFLPFLWCVILICGKFWPITHKKRQFPAEVSAITS